MPLAAIAADVLNSLGTTIAIVDESGTIVAANRRWRDIAHENGWATSSSKDSKFLGMCERILGFEEKVRHTFMRRLRSVLSGRLREFDVEYPCHSRGVRRWFLVRVSRLHGAGPRRAVVALSDVTARILAEHSRRESEDKHRLLLESTGLGIGYYDTRGTVILFNERAAREMGGEASEFKGRTVRELFGPALGGLVMRRINHVVRSGKPYTYEDEAALPTGRKWFISTYSPVRDLQRKIVAVQITSTDISARKKAEKALKESEERYRNLVEVCPDAIAVQKGEKIVLVNKACIRLYGATRAEQLIGLTPFELTPPEIHPLVRQRLKQLLEDRMPVHLVPQTIVRLDGTPRTVEVSASPVMYDGDLAVQAVLRDITERRQAEELLRRSEASLAEAQTLARVGNWQMTYVGGKEVWTSSAELRRIWGLSGRGQFSMQIALSRVHPEDRSRFKEVWEAARLPGGPSEWEFRILVDGKNKWLRSRIHIERDPHGRITTISGMNQDITEQKEAEDRIISQEVALAHLSRIVTVGELASSIAHELNQPLGAGMLYAETCRDLLAAGVSKPNQIVCAIESLIGQLERAKAIVARFRKFLRKQPLSRSTSDINKVVRESVELVINQIKKANVHVEFALSRTPILLPADSTLLQQVLVNLILNAVESLSTMSAQRRRLVLRTSVQRSGGIIITVADNGPGVPRELRCRLFDSFVTTKAHGMGLGLAISRSIVEQHGGKIWYEHGTRGGSRFRFSLPGVETLCKKAR
jgi:PAS domain S-box-containing protein